jgi:sulfite exporter TauE/SafE
LLLFALWLLLRNRPKPVETGPAMDARRVGRRGRLRAAALSVTAVGGAAVFGGLPGLIGAAIARVLGRRRSLRIVLGAALATAGPLVTAVAFARTGPGSVPDVADVLSGIGAVMLLVGALVDHRDGDVRS